MVILSLVMVGCVNISEVKNPKSDAVELNNLEEITSTALTDQYELEYNVVKTDMYLSYDPYDAREFTYNIVATSQTIREVILDISVLVDGKFVKEFTLSIEPFKKSYYRGEVTFDKPATHKFEAKIIRLVYINY
jgi:hypothetical protein